MSENNLAIKFTNEHYYTKKEVQEEMRIPVIDSIWNNVLEYRSNFNQSLTLKHIDDTRYSVCLTPRINEIINSCERKLIRLFGNYLRTNNSNEKNVFKKVAYSKILNSIAQRYNLNPDEKIIENIISKNISTLSPEYLILNRYYQCLNEIDINSSCNIDDDSLAEFYSYLIGDDKSGNASYRINEVNNNLSKVIIGKLYLGIPVSLIESNMNDLFSFIYNSHLSMLIKAISAFYFVYYVKPFDAYTEEIATLTFKKVLAVNDLGPVASFINIENLLNDKEKLESYIIESQKTYDLTYLVTYLLDKIEKQIDDVLEDMQVAKNLVIQGEIYQIDEEENEIEPVLNQVKEERKPEEKVITITKPIQVNSSNPVIYNKDIAIDSLPTGLSEEEALILENHLMESNPNLSRGQAYFYARHCTLNMKYTISQYKKELGCAYETARTSMDHLVYLGYYRKELLKNKFIYTPVKKG